MAVGPIAGHPVHEDVLLVPRGQVGVEGGNDGFALGPPELHVLRVVLHGQVATVAEVDEAAVGFVPTPIPRPVEDLESQTGQILVPVAEAGLFQQEPRRLNAMAGIDEAAVAGVDELAVGTYRLQQGLELGMYVIGPQVVDGLVNLLVQLGIGDGSTDARGGVDEDHRKRVSTGLHCGQVLGLQHAGRGYPTADVAEKVQSLLGIRLVARGDGILGHGDGGEGLGEYVAALAQRRALGTDLEVHAPVGVRAVLLDEVDATLRSGQPLGVALNVVVSVCGDEAEASLEPDGLGAVYQAAVAIDTGVDSPMLAVQAMLHPERQDVAGQVFAVGSGPGLQVILYIHKG